jgi:hypothetical protein
MQVYFVPPHSALCCSITSASAWLSSALHHCRIITQMPQDDQSVSESMRGLWGRLNPHLLGFGREMRGPRALRHCGAALASLGSRSKQRALHEEPPAPREESSSKSIDQAQMRSPVTSFCLYRTSDVALPPCLADQPHLFNADRLQRTFYGRFQHVVHGERCDARACQRLHFNAGLA